MKERLKMIFDRIDILVVCIVFGCCLTISNLWRICSLLYNDFSHYRSLLHPPLQREAEEGADRGKGEAEEGREECK